MNWDFTGAQVVKCEVEYSLEEFRQDLYAEVKENFSDFDKKELDGIYQLAYDVCYCTATQRKLGELLAHDALHRNESCGGHFREEYQTDEGECKRNDEDYKYVAAWEYKAEGEFILHKEPLDYEEIEVKQRVYK